MSFYVVVLIINHLIHIYIHFLAQQLDDYIVGSDFVLFLYSISTVFKKLIILLSCKAQLFYMVLFSCITCNSHNSFYHIVSLCWFGLPEEFHRAVKICTGAELSPHIVDTVFKIFDDDGDGQLSYKEFIAIMRDRLHRGFKVSPGTNRIGILPKLVSIPRVPIPYYPQLPS